TAVTLTCFGRTTRRLNGVPSRPPNSPSEMFRFSPASSLVRSFVNSVLPPTGLIASRMLRSGPPARFSTVMKIDEIMRPTKAVPSPEVPAAPDSAERALEHEDPSNPETRTTRVAATRRWNAVDMAPLLSVGPHHGGDSAVSRGEVVCAGVYASAALSANA